MSQADLFDRGDWDILTHPLVTQFLNGVSVRHGKTIKFLKYNRLPLPDRVREELLIRPEKTLLTSNQRR